MKKILALLVLAGVVLAVRPTTAQTWSATSAPTNYWSDVAASADGSRLAAAALYRGSTLSSNGAIYVSTDFGSNWMVSGAIAGSWGAVASSTNGLKLVAALQGGAIYTSTNGGTNWTLRNSPVGYWVSLASSTDGSHLSAAAGGTLNGLYTSADAGLTWVSNSVSKREVWYGIASSYSGTKLVAISNSSTNGAAGAIYTSVDSGLTWRSNAVPENYWNGVTMSGDGHHLVAVYPGSSAYVSVDGGTNWTARDIPSRYWTSAAASADGTRLVIVGDNLICTSTDSGITWTTNLTPDVGYQAVASSADGNRLVASADGLYTTKQQPGLNLSLSSTNVLLGWSWPSAGYTLQQNTNLATATWVAVTNVSTLVNWQNQIIVSRTNANHFFRLKSP